MGKAGIIRGNNNVQGFLARFSPGVLLCSLIIGLARGDKNA